MKVLLVEDNQPNIELVLDYLLIKDFDVIVARNGKEAVDKALSVQPAIILMDIQLPEMDGLEAIRQIRSNAALATTPIIALTALAMSNDRERCLAAGANEYFTKPVILRQLIETIQAYLHNDGNQPNR